MKRDIKKIRERNYNISRALQNNKNALGNSGGGTLPLYVKEFAELAFQMALLGATDPMLANTFHVTEKTILEWKNQHIEFALALSEGKEKADANVAQAMYHRAIGYSHDDVDIRVVDKTLTTTKITKHYPPEPVAGKFWLTNRQKKLWVDKVNHGLTDEDGNDIITMFKLPENRRKEIE